MARPIVLSNGELHVGIDRFGLVHDFYYPYVGLENHAAAGGMRHKVGVWVEGAMSWLDDGNWQVDMRYNHESLIGATIATNTGLQVRLEFEDCIDSQQAAFLRNIHVFNLTDRPRKIQLYLHQVFRISNSLNGGTVQYLPGEPAILHYKGRRAFVVGAVHQKTGLNFDDFSVGLYKTEGHEGTYRDAEDGKLSSNYVEHGYVDSIVGLYMDLKAHDSERVSYWVAAGKSMHEALHVHRQLKHDGILKRIELTHKDWQAWLKPARRFLDRLPPVYQAPALNSLLILKSHMDKRGAIIASTDTTVLNYNRDAYAYCWPRDASYVLWPLVRLGYRDEALQFFQFCRRCLTPDGYLMHKYQPDSALGSSWHPYVFADHPEPPIQEDETAIVVFLFAEFYTIHRDATVLREYYPSLIKPMADFMASYIDTATHLPHPSYDLWEEHFMTTTYTTAIVYKALRSAVMLAEAVDRQDDAIYWQTAAEELQKAAHTHLWNQDTNYFYKGVIRTGELQKDATVDSSALYGSLMFGLFDMDSEQVTTAIKTLDKTLTQPGTLGYVRYSNDLYYNTEPGSLGNPWFVTTLWRAQYYLESDEIDKAKELLDWVVGAMLPSGVLSEQVRRDNVGAFLSVVPLAWSQAEFLSTLIDLVSDDAGGII